jgi:hypothetical protein
MAKLTERSEILADIYIVIKLEEQNNLDTIWLGKKVQIESCILGHQTETELLISVHYHCKMFGSCAP